MAIALSKKLKQKQNLNLTPSLKKSIDLLQLSRYELIKKIENYVIENPFIEKDWSEHYSSYLIKDEDDDEDYDAEFDAASYT